MPELRMGDLRPEIPAAEQVISTRETLKEVVEEIAPPSPSSTIRLRTSGQFQLCLSWSPLPQQEHKQYERKAKIWCKIHNLLPLMYDPTSKESGVMCHYQIAKLSQEHFSECTFVMCIATSNTY